MKRIPLTLITILSLLLTILLLPNASGRAQSGRQPAQPHDLYLPLVSGGGGADVNQPPYEPSDPSPLNGATAQGVNVDLSWSGGDPDGDAVSYDVYLAADDETPDVLIGDGQSETSIDPGTLAENSHYYWQVVAEDEGGETSQGPVWEFTTGSEAAKSEIFLTLQSPQVSDLTVTMSGTVTATHSTITQLNWQWGDGESDDQWFPAVHTYAISGTYPITVTAYDNLGNTAVVTATVQVENPDSEIVLSLEPPQSTDLTVTVSGTVTATHSTITRLNWQWGDGESDDQGFPAVHTYTISGTYSITATAYDNQGNSVTATTSANVNIGDGQTIQVSISSDGTDGNNSSWGHPGISADGRFVVFESWASNLVSDDTNSERDIFVHDLEMGETMRVSVASNGTEGNDDSGSGISAISGDGRFVAFSSNATNLVPDDTNIVADIFVHDRQAGETTRVSVASNGTEGNGFSSYLSISTDGRFVAFDSEADNLVPGDSNNWYDIFVHDRQTGETTRVSVASDGTQGNSDSRRPAISGDGRFVAFSSDADNLVSGDTNNWGDVFVHDRQTGETTRVSVANDEAQGNHESTGASISADGRFVAFGSRANNLISDDSNSERDIFVRDRQTGETTRISVASGGAEANGYAYGSSISADGRFVAFSSDADNLASGDTNNWQDIFVHDRQTGETTRVSVASEGAQANNISEFPAISANGRFIPFYSLASNLVPGGTDGMGDVFVRDRGP